MAEFTDPVRIEARTMWSRRTFLETAGALGAAVLPARGADLQAISAAAARLGTSGPDDAARDETYWQEIRQAFALAPTLINLNNGNSSPSPRMVQAAFIRYLESSNLLPVYYRGLLEQQVDRVRHELAVAFGCEAAELAITRNATESLHIAQCGIGLGAGDEVLTTDQDYTRMLWAWDQRARRDGVVIRRIQFPVPTTGADLLQRFADAMTPQTKVLHFCHLTNSTGQLFPVRDLCRLARQRGILSIVDGAQALGHIPFALRDLECDVYGTSLHKWLMAPHGTGLLYVRRDNVGRIWPLMPALDSLRDDVRKFEEIGTHPAAAQVAIGEALAFYQAIGAERKAARLRHLTLRWAKAVNELPRVRILSSLDEDETSGLATFGIDGVNARALVQHLFEKHRIIASAVVSQGHPGPVFGYQGVRVTPNIYTSLEEIDRLVGAIEDVVKHGIAG